MKKKTRTIIFVIILFIMLLSVCGVIYFDRHKHDKEIAFAKSAAENYVAEKYGFEAENIEQNNDGAYLTYFYDNDTAVTFKAVKDGKTFHIVYSNWQGKAACYDDYQREEIYFAAEKYIHENFPKGKIADMRFRARNLLSIGSFVGKDCFFDGKNITDILEKCSGHIKMVFYETEFSQSKIESVIPIENINLEFASFDTKAHLDEYFNNKVYPNTYSHFYLELEKYAPHLTDYIKMNNNDVSGYDITILENDEFRYAYFPVEPRKLVTRTDITAEPVEKSKVTEIFTRYGEENSLGKPLSKEYYFDSMYGDVWVYYPLEKLEGYDIENVGLAWFSAGGMSNNHNIEKAQICGEYAVFNIPFGEDYFMLVVTSGLEEYVPNYD